MLILPVTYIQDGSRIRTVNSGDQIEIQSFLLKLVYKQFLLSFQCLLLLMCMLFICSTGYTSGIFDLCGIVAGMVTLRNEQAATLLEFHAPLTNCFVRRWFCVICGPKPPLHGHNWLSFGKFQDTERFLIPCTRHVLLRLPPSGETCKYATVPSIQKNLESFSTYWYAPLQRDHPSYCTAEVRNPRETYELPCIKWLHNDCCQNSEHVNEPITINSLFMCFTFSFYATPKSPLHCLEWYLNRSVTRWSRAVQYSACKLSKENLMNFCGKIHNNWIISKRYIIRMNLVLTPPDIHFNLFKF
jgi:hypothetical protein